MDAGLKLRVRRRARYRCEYCQFPERYSELRFQIDHIIAQQHGGPTNPANLALACFRCNSHKGPNLSGLDPQTGKINRLYHPRRDRWAEHFNWRGARLVGLTPVGRATITVLCINRPDALLTRAALQEEGVAFPSFRRSD